MNPFLKWAGGKRWLISSAEQIFPPLTEFQKYFEPFLGGGAVFFYLKPMSGCLSDINSDLINCYSTIRDYPGELLKLLNLYQYKHSPEFYYSIRSSSPISCLKRAARFIYLNRTCWNGLYRVNQKGKFNVPIGTKSRVLLPDDDFFTLSVLLQDIQLREGDFEETVDLADDGDFVFIDPPYTVKHNLNGFVKYNEKIFSWEDQVRLCTAVKRALNRGVKVLVLNANHDSIKELYKDIGVFIELNRASVIAGDSNARGVCSELAIKCY